MIWSKDRHIIINFYLKLILFLFGSVNGQPQDMGDRAALLRMLSERRDITLASQLRVRKESMKDERSVMD